MESLLQIRDLSVHYVLAGQQEVPALAGASFSIQPGEALGLLGESGCGKTTTALAIMRLLPGNARVVAGSIRFQGRDLLSMTEDCLDKLRGVEISVILQEPALSLNPVMSVGRQVAEVFRAHRPWAFDQCRVEAVRMLERVRFPDPATIYSAFPHQLSGGQRQRILIAQALACGPALVIADEPTTGQDSRTQAEILALLNDLKRQLQTSFLFISHHPGVLSALVDHIVVMYAGRVLEEGSAIRVFQEPLHPYTRGLLGSLPGARSGGNLPRKQRLNPIAGNPPDVTRMPAGCAFAPRCPERMDICLRHEPKLLQMHLKRWVRCVKYETK